MMSKTEDDSKPTKAKFTPEVVFGAVVYNEKYGNTSYGNIKNVVEDAERMRKTYKELHIPEENITFLKDGTWDEVDMLFT